MAIASTWHTTTERKRKLDRDATHTCIILEYFLSHSHVACNAIILRTVLVFTVALSRWNTVDNTYYSMCISVLYVSCNSFLYLLLLLFSFFIIFAYSFWWLARVYVIECKSLSARPPQYTCDNSVSITFDRFCFSFYNVHWEHNSLIHRNEFDVIINDSRLMEGLMHRLACVSRMHRAQQNEWDVVVRFFFYLIGSYLSICML